MVKIFRALPLFLLGVILLGCGGGPFSVYPPEVSNSSIPGWIAKDQTAAELCQPDPISDINQAKNHLVLDLRSVPASNKMATIEIKNILTGVVTDTHIQLDKEIGSWGVAISPDGTRIAYIQKGGVFVANIDGSDNRQIYQSSKMYHENIQLLVWSPFDNLLTFVVDNYNGGPDAPDAKIDFISLDGEIQSAISVYSGDLNHPLRGIGNLEWDKDGSSIFFSAVKGDNTLGEDKFNIYSLPVPTLGVKYLYLQQVVRPILSKMSFYGFNPAGTLVIGHLQDFSGKNPFPSGTWYGKSRYFVATPDGSKKAEITNVCDPVYYQKCRDFAATLDSSKKAEITNDCDAVYRQK